MWNRLFLFFRNVMPVSPMSHWTGQLIRICGEIDVDQDLTYAYPSLIIYRGITV